MIDFNQFTDNDGYDSISVVSGEYFGNQYTVVDAFNIEDGTRFVYVNEVLTSEIFFEVNDPLCCPHEDGGSACLPF